MTDPRIEQVPCNVDLTTKLECEVELLLDGDGEIMGCGTEEFTRISLTDDGWDVVEKIIARAVAEFRARDAQDTKDAAADQRDDDRRIANGIKGL